MMKALQWLATVVFVLAGIALLVAPGHAAVSRQNGCSRLFLTFQRLNPMSMP